MRDDGARRRNAASRRVGWRVCSRACTGCPGSPRTGSTTGDGRVALARRRRSASRTRPPAPPAPRRRQRRRASSHRSASASRRRTLRRGRVHRGQVAPSLDRPRDGGRDPVHVGDADRHRLRGLLSTRSARGRVRIRAAHGTHLAAARSRSAPTRCAGAGKPGSAAIQTLLAHQRDGDPALQYRLEVKTARLLRAHSLPLPVRQFPLGKYRHRLRVPAAARRRWSAKASSTTATGSVEARQAPDGVDRSAGLARALPHLGRRDAAAGRDDRAHPTSRWRDIDASEPLGVGRRSLASSHVAGVDGRGGLDQHDVDGRVGHGAVLDAAWG